MLLVTIDEYTNGYSLDISDVTEHLRIRELSDSKLDVLTKLQNEIDKLIQQECINRNRVYARR